MKYKLNLDNPQTFNEKLQWLKLYNRRPEYTTMVDKYAVKEYIAHLVGKQYIIPTIGVWDSPKEIEWDKLPNQFVLKTTHGGGGCGVIICRDKSSFDRKEAVCHLKSSMKQDIYLQFREWPYKNVKRRILAEKYMVDESGIELKDYKFLCFNGKVQFCKVDYNRFLHHSATFYDREWKIMPFVLDSFPRTEGKFIARPDNLKELIELIERIAKDNPFVRVDCYIIKSQLFIGEITFFPSSGFGSFTPREWDKIIGEKLILSNMKT